MSSIAFEGTYAGAATTVDSIAARPGGAGPRVGGDTGGDPVTAGTRNPLDAGHHMAVLEDGDGDPVVLIHGSPGSAAVWEPVRRILLRDFRVLVPDLVGFGRSSRTRDLAVLAPDAQALAVATALDAADVRDATIVGHDLGATVAAMLTRNRPDLVARLALVAAEGPGGGTVLTGLLAGRRTLRRLTLQLATDATAVPAADYIGDRRQARAVRRLARRDRPPPVDAVLEGLDLPAAVVWGSHDPVAPLARGRHLAALLPRGRLIVVENAGHLLPSEAPREVAHVVRDLVTRPRGA